MVPAVPVLGSYGSFGQKKKGFSVFQRTTKGPAERGHVKKMSKSVKNILRYFSTFFARRQFSGPFWGVSLYFSPSQQSTEYTVLVPVSVPEKRFRCCLRFLEELVPAVPVAGSGSVPGPS